MPRMCNYEPLPQIIELLTSAGSAGMELGLLGKRLGVLAGDTSRIDLLRLKGYLACFPRFMVTQKAKGYTHNTVRPDARPRVRVPLLSTSAFPLFVCWPGRSSVAH